MRRTTIALALVVAAAILLACPAMARAQVPAEILHRFDGRLDFDVPASAISQGTDGDFYVTTARGGIYRHGSLFRMTPAGVVTVLHAFTGEADGSTPLGAVIEASDGSFYGTTESGGRARFGTVFRVTPAGAFTTVHAFARGVSDGAYPRAALMQAADGNFYGTTSQGGESDYGTVFRMTPGGEVTILHSFPGSLDAAHHEGGYPEAALIQTADGNLYGTTSRGGYTGLGAVFTMTTAGVILRASGLSYSFSSSSFQRPYGTGIQTSDGRLYQTGATYSSIIFQVILDDPTSPSHGLLLRIDPIISFYPLNTGPISAFLQALDGDFYGITSRGGSYGHGRVFKWNATDGVTTQYAFSSGTPDAFIQGTDGNFYGTTTSGDFTSDIGTVYRMSAAGTVTVLHTFAGSPEGAGSEWSLLEAADGNFYGTTTSGGRFGLGTAFRMTTSGDVTELHAFAGGSTDGASPSSALVQAADGSIYGMTSGGGAYDGGTIFRLAPGGSVTILHAFAGGATDGRFPYAALVAATDGNIYGATAGPGPLDRATIFRMALDGTVTIVHAFGGSTEWGVVGSLLQARDGNFYGTAAYGCEGRVFRMRPDGAVTTLYSIDLPYDGDTSCVQLPGIIQARDGSLYGTTLSFWGALDTFYKVTLAGQVIVVRRFDPGQFPNVALMFQATDGNFYGASGPNNLYPPSGSSVSRMTPDGIITVLHEFDERTEGTAVTGLVQARDGNFYGATKSGGPFLGGAAFRLRVMPVAPARVTIAAQRGQVRLTWSPTPGATSYILKRALTSGAETVLASGLATTSYMDTAVTNGQTYRYVVSAVNAFGESLNSYEVSITAGRPARVADFDGDGKTDIPVYRPGNGVWYVLKSSTNSTAAVTYTWGFSTDIPVPGDYDGDGMTDIAVYRPSNGAWYILQSSTNFTAAVVYTWGFSVDLPVPGDYDGDGKTDVAIYRPSNGAWYILQSSTNFTAAAAYTWGFSTNLPVPGDYDGDGKTDVAIYRPSNGAWYILRSTTNFTAAAAYTWGFSTDLPVAGDFDGDGKADLAVYRPSNGAWYILQSSTNFTAAVSYTWGFATDTPAPGDYDGDGKTDIVVYRPANGVWYILQSSTNFTAAVSYTWGFSTDIPVLEEEAIATDPSLPSSDG